VGDVVRVLVSAGVFREVIVVSDGSDDATAGVARSAGARVIELDENGGKGAAMAYGVDATDSDVVCFFDADLLGLTEDAVRTVVSRVTTGEAEMNVGLVDRGAAAYATAKRLPLVSGQRAMLKEVFLLTPREHLAGYGVEVALNYTCKVNGLSVGVVAMPGVRVATKLQKVGWLKGLAQYVHMWFWVGMWMLRVRFDRNSFVNGESHIF
jgi:glycosyltransferase involved in cell wall biosynthesis